MNQSEINNLELKYLLLEKEFLIERIKKHIYALDILKGIIEYNSQSIKQLVKNNDPLEISKIDYFNYSPFYFEFDNKNDDVFCEFLIEDLESLKKNRIKKGIKPRANKDYSVLRRKIRTIMWSMNSKYEAITLSLSDLQQQMALIEQKIELKNNISIKNKAVKSIKHVKKAKEISPRAKILRPPNRGELKELCSKYAKELGLKLSEPLKGELIIKIFDQITVDGIKTTKESIASTLRDKLGYKKKKY